MSKPPHIPRNVKHEEMVQRQMQMQQQREFEAKARIVYLSRVASATAASLDALCGNDTDRAEVLGSLLGHVSARAGATLEEFQRFTTKSFEEQSATLARLRAEGKVPPAPVIERPATPPAEPLVQEG